MNRLAFFCGLVITLMFVILWYAVERAIEKNNEPYKMICVVRNHQKPNEYNTTVIWAAESRMWIDQGKIRTKDGVYSPFFGEVCMIANQGN